MVINSFSRSDVLKTLCGRTWNNWEFLFPVFVFAADAEWVRKICCIWHKLQYAFLRSNQPRTAKFMLKYASLLLKNFIEKKWLKFQHIYYIVVNNDLQGISPLLLNKVAIDHILKSVKMIHCLRNKNWFDFGIWTVIYLQKEDILWI